MEVHQTDVAVLGGGSAGCAAVHRLVQEGADAVILVEAGPDFGHAASGRWPRDLVDVREEVGDAYDWRYDEILPDGRVTRRSLARVIGGCSAHNNFCAVWGLPADYDHWAAVLGDPSWSYAALRPLFDRIENANPPTEFRGAGGPLPTGPYTGPLSPWSAAFAAAAQQAGLPELGDLSDPAPTGGVARWHLNVREYTRWNAAFAFLDPVRGHPRLRILGNTHADRLLFKGDRAVAARCLRDDHDDLEIRAERFILTAGAMGTPQILLRSGIGPAEQLVALGIAVVTDLEGVGRNLRDHVSAEITYTLTPEAARCFSSAQDAEIAFFPQVVARAPNPLSSPGGYFHIMPGVDDSTDEPSPTLPLTAFFLNPVSTGALRLGGPGPKTPPAIRVGYLSDPRDADLKSLRAVVTLLREIAAQPALRRFIDREAPETRGLHDAELDEYIRGNFGDYAHLVGTCRMGSSADPTAVTDARGIVLGTSNVIVADASIMPTPVSANTNLTAMLLGYKLAGTALGRGVR